MQEKLARFKEINNLRLGLNNKASQAELYTLLIKIRELNPVIGSLSHTSLMFGSDDRKTDATKIRELIELLDKPLQLYKSQPALISDLKEGLELFKAEKDYQKPVKQWLGCCLRAYQTDSLSPYLFDFPKKLYQRLDELNDNLELKNLCQKLLACFENQSFSKDHIWDLLTKIQIELMKPEDPINSLNNALEKMEVDDKIDDFLDQVLSKNFEQFINHLKNKLGDSLRSLLGEAPANNNPVTGNTFPGRRIFKAKRRLQQPAFPIPSNTTAAQPPEDKDEERGSSLSSSPLN